MNTSPAQPATWWRRTLTQLGRDLTYLLPQLPLSVFGFVVAVTLASVSLGTAVIWVGVPLGAFTLLIAGWLGTLERRRLLAATGHAPVAVFRPAPEDAGAIRKVLYPYWDPQRWKDLAYAIVDFPVGVFVWSAIISWGSLAIAGPTAWMWEWALPDDEPSGVAILDWLDSLPGLTITGLIALGALPWVARGLVVLQQGMGELFLGSSEDAILRAEVTRLERQGRVAATAEAQSLRKIERDLHDGPQQRLLRLAMDIQQAEAALDKDPEAAKAALASARDQGAEALAELRQLTRGIAPPILVERGLAAALESAAERGAIPIAVEAQIDCELSAAAETALYFVASEALANVAKHSEANAASIVVETDGDVARIMIADDGVGGAHPAKGHGLAGLADRVEGAGGTLTVADAPGGGTVITAEVPCA